MKPEQERLRVLLVDTIALLCKSGLGFKNELKIQGLLGITIDSNSIFIVHMDETFPESPAHSRRNVSAGRDTETRLVPAPVAELNESLALSVDNAPSPRSGSKAVHKRSKMDVQAVKQELEEWEKDASAWSATQQESSKIGTEDQNAIGKVFGSETKSSEVVWIDSDALNDCKDRINLKSQPDRSFEAGNELVGFDRSTSGSCGSKLFDVPVNTNTSGMIVKVEGEKEVRSDIGRIHGYRHSPGKRKYIETVAPVTVNTASASSVFSSDNHQWQTDGVFSYPIPTAVSWENEDDETEQEDCQELSNWENNSQEGPNKGSTQNGDREKSFVCQYNNCDKAFYRKDHLNRHQHHKHDRPLCIDKKPFVCQYPDCDKSFFRKDHLYRHQRDKHGKPFGVDSRAIYFCHFANCARMFYSYTLLLQHMSESHGHGLNVHQH